MKSSKRNSWTTCRGFIKHSTNESNYVFRQHFKVMNPRFYDALKGINDDDDDDGSHQCMMTKGVAGKLKIQPLNK